MALTTPCRSLSLSDELVSFSTDAPCSLKVPSSADPHADTTSSITFASCNNGMRRTSSSADGDALTVFASAHRLPSPRSADRVADGIGANASTERMVSTNLRIIPTAIWEFCSARSISSAVGISGCDWACDDTTDDGADGSPLTRDMLLRLAIRSALAVDSTRLGSGRQQRVVVWWRQGMRWVAHCASYCATHTR